MRRWATYLGIVVLVATVAPVLGGGPAAAAPGGPSGVSAAAEGLTIRVTWSPPTDLTGVTGYRVTAVPVGPSVDVPVGAGSAVLTGVRPNTPYTAQVATVAGGSSSPPVPADVPVTVAAPGGSLRAVTPARLLDTRSGLGAPAGATHQVDLQVTGRGGIPASGVGSVALNVTVTQPAGAGFVTVYPSGTLRPTASNLNYVAGQTVPNLVVVPVGADGRVTLYSSAAAHLIADTAGWFSTTATAAPSAGLFHGLTPARLADTRIDLGGPTPDRGGVLDLQVTGAGGVPATGVSAVVLNTTVAGSTGPGFVTVYPSGQPAPTASNLNFVAGQVVANRAIVPVSTDGKVSFLNSNGLTPLVVDVTGWFTDGSDPGAGGAYFSGVPPTRIVDTRTGLGAPSGPVAGGTSLPVHAAGHAGLPEGTAPVPATGMVATVTAVAPTAAGYLTVYPSLTAQPTASDLNFTPATYAVPNLVVDPLGVDGADLVFNYAGGTHVVVDVVGYFIGDTALPATTRTAAAGDITAVSGPPDGVRQVTLAPAAPVPAVGEVLAAGSTPATPDGLLGLVTATGTDGAGHPVLITEPAPLQQALGNGHFAIAGTLSADNVAKAGTVPKTPAGSPVSQAISKAFTCSAGGSLSVTGSVSITPTFNLSVEWGWFSLRSATFTGTLSEDASLVASAHAAAGCSAGPVPLLPTPIRFSPITFSIGPVPVVITPQLQFYLSASGTVSADLTASAVQHASGTLGVSWSNGGLHPIAQTASGFTYTPPTPSTSADVTASVGPRLQLFLYGLAGPYLSVDASIDLAVNPPATPWWTLTGGLDAGAGIAFPALDFDQGNPSILHYRKVIAHAPWPEHIYAVECLTSDCYTSMRLVQTDDAGGGKRVIGGTFSGGGLGLAVSPDGTQVVFEHATPNAGILLFVRDVGTGQERQLTFQDPACTEVTFDSYPTWSTDGKTIGFSRSSSFGWSVCPSDGLYIVPAGGGSVTRVTTDRLTTGPSWNPPATRWAISSTTAPVVLYTSATNGTNRQNVYTAPAGEYLTATSWSPDGSTIAVVHPVGTTGTGVLGFAPSGTRLWTINTPGSCGSEIAWARDSESFFQLACTAGSHTGTIYRYPATSNAQPATIGFDHVLAGLAVGR